METKYNLLKTAYDNFGRKGSKSIAPNIGSSGFNDYANQNYLQNKLIRRHLKNNYAYRMAAAVLGIWGNSTAESHFIYNMTHRVKTKKPIGYLHLRDLLL